MVIKRVHTRIFLSTVLLVLSVCCLQAQSYEIQDGDTINKVDERGMKQGEWIITGKIKNDPEFEADQVALEGEYVNNRKQGIWIEYFPNKNIKSVITYVNHRPKGEYKIYYSNGQLEEHGFWNNNRNIGEFKRFYDNGAPQQEFVFNTTGKRNGTQKYYHPNGQLMIIGEILEGKENGEFREYYEDGSIKSIKVFDEPGLINTTKTQTFKPKDQSLEKKQQVIPPVDNTKEAPVEKDFVQNEAEKITKPFKGTGDHTLYNNDRQITQKGYFENFKLMDGLYYRYNENGILTHIERYKGGKYVGDAPIEDGK